MECKKMAYVFLKGKSKGHRLNQLYSTYLTTLSVIKETVTFEIALLCLAKIIIIEKRKEKKNLNFGVAYK